MFDKKTFWPDQGIVMFYLYWLFMWYLWKYICEGVVACLGIWKSFLEEYALRLRTSIEIHPTKSWWHSLNFAGNLLLVHLDNLFILDEIYSLFLEILCKNLKWLNSKKCFQISTHHWLQQHLRRMMAIAKERLMNCSALFEINVSFN